MMATLSISAYLARALADRLMAERERWILWLPVGIGLGVAWYFALYTEPPAWAGAAATTLFVTASLLARHRAIAPLVCLAALSVALGFTAAQFRTARVAAPILAREIGPVPVTGRVLGVDRLEKGVRVLLTELSIPRLAADATPGMVRIRLRDAAQAASPGERIRVKAVLAPPGAPVAPGAHDFARTAFFAGIGGNGYAVGQVERVEPVPVGEWADAMAAVERFRLRMSDRINSLIGGSEGRVIDALMTGEQTGIPEHVMNDFRVSGLAHLLSISGLHVSLVAGLIFVPVRALLALIEPVALNWAIKKIAAVAAMAGTVCYMLLVGSPVPTERSVLMTGLALGAILMDRNPFSMRLIAFAATVLLLKEPESLLGASFQMSFGAVTALIAAYEVISPAWRRLRLNRGPFGRAMLQIAGIVVTSVVASLATTPFSMFHFQQIQYYGVLSNMIAVPVTSFWVMPLCLISYLAMPFGLDQPFLVLVGWGATAILETARLTAALPGASQLIEAMPALALPLVALGGCWLTLWRRRWRLLGVPIILGALLTAAFHDPPDILVDEEGKLMAVRDADGGLSLSSRIAGRFDASIWLRRDGRLEGGVWPREGKGAGGLLDCDRSGCLYRAKGRTVALARVRQALTEDCGVADVVISADPAPRACSAKLVVDLWRLRREGAHQIWLSPGAMRVATVAAERGDRPWTKPSHDKGLARQPD
ncbi:competence protein ComEC [Skermanella stibiiresistens SB22]|uniref:Competence protein ComEC n=1 Tax=Skermanella stibiiresistens SB22 TaxID=1385369 RepID=W9H7F9_9PROT|nr:ComEC/Rec2 family competence protein [Skermanella stibiiresistens]EWY42155.1 competence protein ComEC [Skermanella stibiiresistens SB22]